MSVSDISVPTGTIPGLQKPVSRLVQGCMMLGSQTDEQCEQSFGILDRAFERGIRAFDHSTVYGGGACERTFGEWLQARGVRDELVIVAKGAHHNADRQRVTPHDIATDVADTLARMQVDAVDAWLFHRDDESQPVGPLAEALQAQIDAGRVSVIGASNWSVARILEFNAYADAKGLTRMTITSPNFSLARQLDEPWANCTTISGPENAGDRAALRDAGLAVFSWSSLARGFLSGRITPANFAEVKDQFEEHTIRCYVADDNWDRLERATALGEQKGLSVAQIALAFVLSQDFDAYALVGSYTAAEADANVAAASCRLNQAECDWIDLRSDERPF